MIPVHIIVAIDEKNGIGKGGNLPWHLSGDLKRFRDITCQTTSPKKKNIVVMGRKTWNSIPKEFQPLPDRINVVMTRDPNLRFPDGVLKAESFNQVLETVNREELKNIIETIFVIGGQQVYQEAIKYPECQTLRITQVHGKFDCDTFFPDFSQEFQKVESSLNHNEGPIIYHFEDYKRKNA